MPPKEHSVRCAPARLFPCVPPGAVRDKCDHCGVAVVCAPASAARRTQGFLILCFDCADRHYDENTVHAVDMRAAHEAYEAARKMRAS